MLKKVFGIISYFPDNDTAYHKETRRERSRRFRELLFKLDELWPNVDIMIIAQNWQDFELPEIRNKIRTFHYGKLGILRARKELRKRFLDSDYDYLIMLDDDFIISSTDPQGFLDEIDKHPDGFGAIRRAPSPLPFFSISKSIYSQIELPDIDPEKGEGFEDDVFSATCFARFPDKGFMFSEGLAEDKSFHYEGPGKCPSSWSKESKRDWDYMRNHTKSVIYKIEHPEEDEIEEIPVEPTIDLILTYVNSSDSSWVKDYIRTTKTHNPSATRFRSWGTLKYLLRSIDTYMPFVRNVVLVVAKPSQVPAWLNQKNIRVVYHEDFIPKQFLPTFNSCTIESFFWNIPDLADRIIYFNDDMFPINMLKESDFFTDSSPNIRFTDPEVYAAASVFRNQCRSGMDMIMKALDLPRFESGKIIRPYHISTAFTRDCLDSVAKLCKDMIPDTITTLRAFKNVNQYIYAYYHYFTNTYTEKTVDYKYFELADRTIDAVVEEILNGEHQMVCINDSDKMKDFSKISRQLTLCFTKKFPDKSRFEL